MDRTGAGAARAFLTGSTGPGARVANRSPRGSKPLGKTAISLSKPPSGASLSGI
jgi:hypothetical protein